MARDRQKAKQRKAKREAQQQKNKQRAADKSKRSEQREERLEEIEQEGVGRESMSGTGIAAEVELDQARMDAELEQASAPDRDGSGEATAKIPAAETAPHVEESKRQRRQRERAEQKTRQASKKAGRGRGDRGGQSKRDKQGRKPRERGRVSGFFAQVWAELKRVQWPTRDQVLQASGVVVGFCVVAGAYLALWDFLWQEVVDRVF